MEAVCRGVPAPFCSAVSVTGLQASHPFGGGNAGGRMSEREISDAVVFIAEAMAQHRAKYGTTTERGRERLRTAARAIMQLWRDLEEQEQVERKALA